MLIISVTIRHAQRRSISTRAGRAAALRDCDQRALPQEADGPERTAAGAATSPRTHTHSTVLAHSHSLARARSHARALARQHAHVRTRPRAHSYAHTRIHPRPHGRTLATGVDAGVAGGEPDWNSKFPATVRCKNGQLACKCRVHLACETQCTPVMQHIGRLTCKAMYTWHANTHCTPGMQAQCAHGVHGR